MKLSPDKRRRLIHLLLAGFSHRKTAEMVGCCKHTVTNYAMRISLERSTGHRSPITYRHKNQVTEWWQKHDSGPSIYDEDRLNWMLGGCTMDEIQKRTNRQCK